MNIHPISFLPANSRLQKSQNKSGYLAPGLQAQVCRDTVTFKQRTYDNKDPNTQLYRAVGEREVIALCDGKTIEGASYATSDPKGWMAKRWGSGHPGNYFVTFDKKRITFMDHRDDDSDTRYLVDEYNLGDVLNIRKGNHAHGKMIYSSDFSAGKQLDIENKKQDIANTVEKLKLKNLSFDEGLELIQNLKSYSEEFPLTDKIIKYVLEGSRNNLNIIFDKDDLEPAVVNINKAVAEKIEQVTPQKINLIKAQTEINKKLLSTRSEIEMLQEVPELYGENLPEAKAEIAEEIKNYEKRVSYLNNKEHKTDIELYEIDALTSLIEMFNNTDLGV